MTSINTVNIQHKILYRAFRDKKKKSLSIYYIYFLCLFHMPQPNITQIVQSIQHNGHGRPKRTERIIKQFHGGYSCQTQDTLSSGSGKRFLLSYISIQYTNLFSSVFLYIYPLCSWFCLYISSIYIPEFYLFFNIRKLL